MGHLDKKKTKFHFSIKADLQDHDGVPLVDQGLGECSQALLNLVICGNATPYVHNSTASVDDEVWFS